MPAPPCTMLLLLETATWECCSSWLPLGLQRLLPGLLFQGRRGLLLLLLEEEEGQEEQEELEELEE